MRERCLVPSRHQCIKYVVSYPRLSRITRRNGTGRCLPRSWLDYLRFCVRLLDALFLAAGLADLDAGLRAGARRFAGRVAFFSALVVLRRAAGAAARARPRAGALAAARAGAGGRGAAGTATALIPFASGTADFWTNVKRGWSPMIV